MNPLLAGAIVVAATALSVVAMLLVRRHAPDGSYFSDGDRAAGVFGVLATGFAVLLGFVVFLAFTSYDAARTGAEDEARVLAQQMETAQLLPAPASEQLTGELVCYARSVAGPQWERMEAGDLGEELNPWGVALFRTISSVDPETPSSQAAFGKWLDQTTDREAGRSGRLHGARGVIPPPLWVVLFFSGAVIVVYLLFFADSGERAVVQAVLMGSVVAVLTTMLLLLQYLDDPFHGGFGALGPDAMERTLEIMDHQIAAVGWDGQIPCDGRGLAL